MVESIWAGWRGDFRGRKEREKGREGDRKNGEEEGRRK
jgi:hypothetical protein